MLLGGASGVVNQALDLRVDVSADFASRLKNEPGRYNYASGGLGSSNHFATEFLLTMSGMRATHIPYNSSATAIASVISVESCWSCRDSS